MRFMRVIYCDFIRLKIFGKIKDVREEGNFKRKGLFF